MYCTFDLTSSSWSLDFIIRFPLTGKNYRRSETSTRKVEEFSGTLVSGYGTPPRLGRRPGRCRGSPFSWRNGTRSTGTH